jgi:hypothetical protein
MSDTPLLDWVQPMTYPAGVPADVCRHFEKIALELLGLGFKRYSADAILHRIRWHMHVECGNLAFKCNDHWTAPLARWFLKRNPKAAELFELRERADA